MKVRVKGLVFVGFAAAIFAQSAMADNNADAKTVTSKLYVDQKVETTTGTGTTNDPYVSTITANNANADTKAPSIRNVYEFVTKTVGSVDVVSGDDYVDVDVPESGANAGKFVVSIENDMLTSTAAGIRAATSGTGAANQDALDLPTVGAVKAYAEDKENKATAIVTGTGTGHNYDSDVAYPTTKAVYDYAQQKVLDNSNLYVGSKGAWGQLSSATSNGATSNDYVTIKETGTDTGVYKVNIAADSIASDSAAITTGGTINTGTEAQQNAAKGKLATAKAVYDFVSTYGGNTYQPKVGGAGSVDSTSGKSKVMVGYSTRTGSSGSYEYSSTWQPLSGDDYITVGLDASDNPEVKLGNFAASNDLYGTNNTNDAKLVRAGIVRGITLQASGDGTQGSPYATTITGSNQNDKFPSAQNVFEYVQSQTGGNVIPTMSADCRAAINGTTPNNHCALVASWDATLNNNTGGIVLEWTVIAQP